MDRGVNLEALNVDTLTAAKVAMEKKHQRLIETLAEHKKSRNAALQVHATVTMSEATFGKMMGDVAAGEAARNTQHGNEGGKKTVRRSNSAATGLKA